MGTDLGEHRNKKTEAQGGGHGNSLSSMEADRPQAQVFFLPIPIYTTMDGPGLSLGRVPSPPLPLPPRGRLGPELKPEPAPSFSELRQ